MAMFEFVPQDEFETELAEHLEALEAGDTVTPPQQRAAEHAAATGGWSTGPLTPTFSAPVPAPAPAAAPVTPAAAEWAGWPTQPS